MKKNWNGMSDADFRQEVRRFLEAEYPATLRHVAHRPRIHELRPWLQKLHAAGWSAPAWPAEYGGMGLNPAKLLILYDEE